MRLIISLFVACATLLFADDGGSFFDADDPAVVHNVNVITGHLNLTFQDSVVNGALPLPIRRYYSSHGALNPVPDPEVLALKERTGGRFIQGGWNFLPHTHLIFKQWAKKDAPLITYTGAHAELTLDNGSAVIYTLARRTPHHMYFKLSSKHNNFNVLSSRNKAIFGTLKLNLKEYEAHLRMPNGALRYYKLSGHDSRDTIDRVGYCTTLFTLMYEILPSGHRIDYFYKGLKDKEGKLRKIKIRNPGNTKTYTKLEFYFSGDTMRMQSSDGKWIAYDSTKYKKISYLQDVHSSFHPPQRHCYGMCKESSLRFESILSTENVPLLVEYDKATDKVARINMPVGKGGEMVPVAQFSYDCGITSVRDANNILTKYHHNQTNLSLIEYFDEGQQLHHTVTFHTDEEGQLIRKELKDSDGSVVIEQSYRYDDNGNVIEALQEGITKRSSYLTRFNLPVFEQIDEGLTVRYGYKEGTDLLTSKQTYDGDRLLISERLTYNEDHLLTSERIEDGATSLMKSYELDPVTGLPVSMQELYLEEGREICLGTHRYHYTQAKLIAFDEFYDSEGQYRYTIYTDYNTAGQVIRKTTALGAEYRYEYDLEGRLINREEPGSAPTYYSYDKAGRCVKTEQNGKISTTSYDHKSRPIAKTDFRGETTYLYYDAFDNLIETVYPDGSRSSASYDILGNKITTTDQNGSISYASYNSRSQPIRIETPDGGVTEHFYNLKGTLARTTQPTGIEILYNYDSFDRMIAKKIIDRGATLSEESWRYNHKQMLSHTLPSGLTTTYRYDGAGRPIEEDCAGRYKRYHYDPMGLIDSTFNGEITQHKRYDLEGRVVEEWDGEEPRENYTQFFYNGDGRKESALRQTSQGEARDYFKYDAEGRLIEHTDPYGAITQILYDDFASSKTVVDPIGNSTTETYDAMNRLILVEKRGPDGLDGVLLFEERYEYDFAGNKIAQRSMGHSIAWEYDCMNRVTQEIEADQKITRYAYDISGNIIKRTLPSGIEIDYSYDKIGHLLSCKSEGIDYQYRYDLAGNPISITDHSTGKTLHRSYNLFGEITSETNPAGITLRWEYNPFGRCTRFTLPDSSTISYRYKEGRMQAISRDGKYEHCYTAFDPNGHVQSEELIYNLGTLDSFRDLLERATAQSSTWLTHSFAYGLSGLVTSRKNSIFGDISYSHDGLNQLSAEGDKEHHFDPLGNPQDAEVNSLNQILTRSGLAIVYDGDGNPLRRGSTQYFYDALSRLTRILYEDGREVHYSYDPLNRLLSKTADGTTIYYLYDKEFEIGTLNRDQQITHLKVLGLGIRGDIGAGVAIETPAGTFAPLHDLRGNIIALIDREGALAETYDIEAFGDEIFPKPSPISPWRFSSKRSEESLIFFGLRFYDPILGRFLTPDPSGFADGPNLYAYTRANPMNRLDLFGLLSDGFGVYYPFKNQVFSGKEEIFSCGANAYGNDFTMGLSSIHFNHFQPAPGTMREGQVHINQLLEFANPLFKTPMIGMSLAMNGIMTSEPSFREFCAITYNRNPGLPLLAVHNPTSGPVVDIVKTLYAGEIAHSIVPSMIIAPGMGVMIPCPETRTAINLGHTMAALLSYVSENNPHARILMTTHSGGGSQWSAAYYGMTTESQKLCSQKLFYIGLAPATPFPKEAAIYASNLYSEYDWATKDLVNKLYCSNSAYDIKMLRCLNEESLSRLSGGDHAYNSPTYNEGYLDEIKDIKKMCSIYDSTTR